MAVHREAMSTNSTDLLRMYTAQWLLWRSVCRICDLTSKSDVSNFQEDFKLLQESVEQFAQLIFVLKPDLYLSRVYVSLIRYVLPACVKHVYDETGLPYVAFGMQSCEKHNGVSRAAFSVYGTTTEAYSLTLLKLNKYFQRGEQELLHAFFGTVEAIGTSFLEYDVTRGACGQTGHEKRSKLCPQYVTVRFADLFLSSANCDSVYLEWLQNLPLNWDKPPACDTQMQDEEKEEKEEKDSKNNVVQVITVAQTLTREEASKMKIPQLKTLLKARGLPVSGKKNLLIERLFTNTCARS